MFGDQTASGAKVADIIVITSHPVMKDSLYFPSRHFAEGLFANGKQTRQPAPYLKFSVGDSLERVGAVMEGVLRNHMILPDGHYRHSVYYSILDTEWPEVKKRLEEIMGGQRPE